MSESRHSPAGYAIMTLGALILGKMALDIVRELLQDLLLYGAIVVGIGVVAFRRPILLYLQERGYLTSGASTPATVDNEWDESDGDGPS